MRQAGVTEAPARERRSRAWVDFGVDETWAPARPTRTRRERRVDSWVDDAELFAPRYEDDIEPARPAPVATQIDGFRPSGSVAAPARVAESQPRRRIADSRSAPLVVQTDAGPVSVDVLAHPAHVPAPVPAPGWDGASSPDTALPEPEVAPRGVPDGRDAPPRRASQAREAAPRRAPEAREDAPVAAGPGAGVPGRRTVTIRGRGAERDLAFPEPGRARRPPVRRHERPGFKPDRTALWALVLGVVLVLVAATSSHAATVTHARSAAPTAARVAHLAAAPTALRLSAAPRR